MEPEADWKDSSLRHGDTAIMNVLTEPKRIFGVQVMKMKQLRKDRRHPRETLSVCAWLEFRGEPVARGTVSVDLALEGARFNTLGPVSKGDPVLVRLQLEPSFDTIECKGRICWVERADDGIHEFGVRFVDLRDDERRALRKYIDRSRKNPALAVL